MVRSSATAEEARRESASLLPPTFSSRAPSISWQQVLIYFIKFFHQNLRYFIQEGASTCCLIKPHAMAQAGAIIEVSNIISFAISIPCADNLKCWNKKCYQGTPRGRLQLAWHGHQPINLPPGRRVLRSVQVAQ